MKKRVRKLCKRYKKQVLQSIFLLSQKDIDEIKADYLKGLKFHFVEDIRQVIDLALLDEKVDNPLF